MIVRAEERDSVPWRAILRAGLFKWRPPYLLIAAVWQLGCSASLDVVRNRSDDTSNLVTYEDVKRRVGDQIAKICLKDGERIDARVIDVQFDSTRFVDLRDSSHRTIETLDIVSIEVTNATVGMIEGLLFGAATGAGLFDVLHTLSESDNSLWSPWLRGIAGDRAPRGAIVGSVTGLLLGWVRGSTVRFNIEKAQRK